MKNLTFTLLKEFLFLMGLHWLLKFMQLKHSTVVSNALSIDVHELIVSKGKPDITLCCLYLYFVILFTLSLF